ncbi:UDP-glucuronosyl/UDP-glucosyltransferase [Parasponia andersonii]|uniref:UDP-glucuronosyl/UDP-glucosyltransferase n=1 Tax=Parasponia andersonii TaxID=3476 RepID=A0A2P5AV75_PARAD|nr:UDP-glucuronosyl/UDP-glucosyltransferase [Parasponia andersonii]
MVLAACSPQSASLHVAVLPSPGMGHIIPLLNLASRLAADHGCHVSFLNITAEATAAQNQLLGSHDLPPTLHVIDIPPADVSTQLAEDTPAFTRLCHIAEDNLVSLKSVLLDLGKPNAVIIDIFCTQAFEVCEELSIPVYTFFTASAALFAFSLYLPIMDREIDGEFVDLPEPVRVPGCSPIRTEDLILQVTNRKMDEYKWYLHHSSRLPKAAGIFLNTWEDFEPVTVKAIRENPFYHQIPTPPIYPIGPLTKETEPISESGAKCLEWLDNQPPESVLFVALGSGGMLTTAQLAEVAWGLALSGQRFVWVVRAPSDEDPTASFFSVGGDVNDAKTFLPEGFVERTKEVGHLVPSWAPQAAVLRHRSTGGFWSHCGWNSTLESMSHGVPMIAWPLYAEQRMNATVLAEEVGVAVKPAVDPGRGIVPREEIKRVVRLVIEGKEGKAMRQKARGLKESAAKALNGGGGSSFDSLSRVVKEWKGTVKA